MHAEVTSKTHPHRRVHAAGFVSDEALRILDGALRILDGALRILDVACGTGDDVLALAELCGPGTLVIGLERRLELVEEAKRRARNVALNVRFAVGDERSLPFRDASFDLVHAGALPSCDAERAQVVRELVRVLRPGGQLLISDKEKLAKGRAPVVPELGAGPTLGEDLLAHLERAGLVELEAWPSDE